jgi:hypothetical protein
VSESAAKTKKEIEERFMEVARARGLEYPASKRRLKEIEELRAQHAARFNGTDLHPDPEKGAQ